MLDVIILGLMAGGILALIAVGLTLIFGVMDVMNFAHGEFVMLGMLGTTVAVTAWGLSPYVAAIVVIALGVPLALVVYYAAIRPTLGKSLNIQIFTTLGVSIVLQAVALIAFGPAFRAYSDPFTSNRVSILGVNVEMGRIIAFAVGLLLIGALWYFLQHTNAGRVTRAVAEDNDAAKILGLEVERAYVRIFIVGTVFAVTAGALISTFTASSPTSGLRYILTSFVIVVLGGFGSVKGALIGGLVVGIVESFAGYYLGTQWMQAAIFAVFILVLALRPQGLFGKKSVDSAMVGG